MRLKELIASQDLQVLSSGDLNIDVGGVIVSDLLSYVMGNTHERDLWLTIQTHMNVVAVASLGKVAAVIITCGYEVSDEVVKKAQEENVTILKSQLSAFELSGRLYMLGIR